MNAHIITYIQLHSCNALGSVEDVLFYYYSSALLISKIVNIVTGPNNTEALNSLMPWMESEVLSLKDGVGKSKTESDHMCSVHTLVSHQTFTVLNKGDRNESTTPYMKNTFENSSEQIT